MKKLLLSLCMCLLLVGCYSTPNTNVSGSLVKVSEENGISTYAVVGIGVIRVKHTPELTVIDNSVFGVSMSDIECAKFLKVGIIGEVITSTKPDSNNIFEVKKGFPFTGVEIKIKKEDGK